MTLNLIDQDKQQRLLTLDPAQSFIVQAPAGSGKTELLIQRFLTLLIHVNKPEEILAITFTKKAANEMRLRVIKALKQALSDPEPVSDHAKKTWSLAQKVLQRDKQFHWNLIDNPNQLRIQTIDSLCSYLTKQLPLLSHFGSQPDIADHPTALYREAVQAVLMQVEEDNEWSDAIAKLLLHLDNDLNKLHDLLISLLAKRDQWLPYIQLNTHESHIRKQLEHYLGLIISDSLRSVAELFPVDMAQPLLAIARFAADNLTIANKESDIIACRDRISLPGTKPTDKQAWVGLAKLILTKSFSWRKRVDEDIGFPTLKNLKNSPELATHQDYRQRLTQLIILLSERDDLRLALTELFFLPEPHYLDSQWDILQALLQVLKIAAAQLRLTFQQYGQIDFIENAQAALLALGNDEHPTDLALALDYQIQHILIDEFQDTSFTQYQLIEKLTAGWTTHDGRTLFVVGDPMQSIYRFREAEVGLFIRMRKMGIGQLKLIPVTLAINFRSTPSIVEWNNTHFQRIFPSFNDMATGAVTYSPSVSHQETWHEIDTIPSPIIVRGFVNAEQTKQADAIINLIYHTKQAHPEDTIAILVRSRSHLKTLIPALKKANLPYRAIDIDPLVSRQPIQDLLSLACALLHPADRIAWLSILRAPWCGLTLADLLSIAGSHPYASIWELLEKEDTIQRLSPDGQQRVLRFISLLKNKIAERERYPLRYWIESTWLLLGGPACLTDEADMEDVKAFFTLLEEIASNTQVIHLDKLKERIDQLYASTQHENAVLQIMTIHTAKGLEFDTVILPQLDRKLPNDDKSLLQWMERPLTNDQTALLLAPIHAIGNDKDSLYEYIHRQQKIKLAYETDRLLYVATTRAKKRLYLFFNAHRNDNNEYKMESGSFLEKLWPFLEKQKDHVLCEEVALTTDMQLPNEKERYLTRLMANWQNPIQDMPPVPFSAHQKQSGFMLRNHQSKLIGVMTHRVLQHIAQLGTTWWETAASTAHYHYLQTQFMQLGMLSDDVQNAIRTVLQSIQHTLSDPRGQWILHAHQEAQSEFAISAMINGVTQNLVIDRTFVDEAGIRWIIDYKTTTPTYQNIKDFLKQEQEKYREQMLTYCHAIQLIDNRPIRLGLYFPEIPAWSEWQFGLKNVFKR